MSAITMIETDAQRAADMEPQRVAIMLLAALQRIHARSNESEVVDIAAEAIAYASGEHAPEHEDGCGVDAAGTFNG